MNTFSTWIASGMEVTVNRISPYPGACNHRRMYETGVWSLRLGSDKDDTRRDMARRLDNTDKDDTRRDMARRLDNTDKDDTRQDMARRLDDTDKDDTKQDMARRLDDTDKDDTRQGTKIGQHR